MDSASFKLLRAIIVFAIVGTIGFFVWQITFVKPQAKLYVNNAEVTAHIAATDEERTKGLSGMPMLHPDQAMLFLFPYSDHWGVWMKDMNFAIDTVWLNQHYKVVHIQRNMTPESYPKTFKPAKKAQYIIEFPAGSVRQYDIKIGQSIKVDFKK